MNRAELAALLASTHRHLSEDQSQLQHSVNINGPPPLSPRQLFQSRVRTLSDDGAPSPQRSPNRRRGELQHLSSLRVHVTSPRTARHGASPRSSHAFRTRDGRFGFSPHEPDFIAEERAAWTGASIERVGNISPTNSNAWTAVDQESLRLSEDSAEDSSKNSDPASVQAFAPSLTTADLDERPKTSRGTSMPGTFPRPHSEPAANVTPARISKFLEGSMNGRSEGVSSSWEHLRERLSTDQPPNDDSDSTPRAAHMSTESFDREDLSEFRPATAGAATFRQRLSKLTNPFRSSEEPSMVTQEVQKQPLQPKKKGLRKSISSWNFHNLGGKVKFFGASASDSLGGSSQASHAGTTEQLDVLTERKRKAEEAYAEQFGNKKQKTNDGISAEDRNRTIRAPSRTLRKRAVSGQRTPSAQRQRPLSATTPVPIQDPTETSKAEAAQNDWETAPASALTAGSKW